MEFAMAYKISTKYCWYDDGTKIVKMYFINGIPFTFDELPHYASSDAELVKVADRNRSYEPKDMYRYSFYLIDEEVHPCLFPVELENPEEMPVDE